MLAKADPLLSNLQKKPCQEDLSMGVIWIVVSVAIAGRLRRASCERGTAAHS